jgi:alkanesulfonate monooxygenase SsuD/methylene tetrahydromethanopterin reductase-like flavin-dependent oxidoreductase (luciferase family)
MRIEPRPQLNVAAITPAGARRAGRYGDGWVASTTVPLAQIAGIDAAFRAERGGPGTSLPVLRDVVVRATDEEARALAKPFLDPPPPPPGSSAAFKPDVDTEGAYLIGSPTTVIEKLRAHAAAGVDHVIFRPQRPGISLGQAKETLRILATDVVPALR